MILKIKDIDNLGIGCLDVHAKHLSEKVNSFSKIDISFESISEGLFCVSESNTKRELLVITNLKDFCKNVFLKEKNHQLRVNRVRFLRT